MWSKKYCNWSTLILDGFGCNTLNLVIRYLGNTYSTYRCKNVNIEILNAKIDDLLTVYFE